MSTKARLATDARNRALRSFVQGLALDVGLALALVVYGAVQTDEPDYRLLLASLVKTALLTAASYVMRRYGDPSRLPTPLPPEDPADPADEGAGELRLILCVAAGVLLSWLILGLLA